MLVAQLSRATAQASTSTSGRLLCQSSTRTAQRCFSSIRAAQREATYTRVQVVETVTVPGSIAADKAAAMPRTPANVPKYQAPNDVSTWSQNQNPRQKAMRGPRFEQTLMDFQPQPLAAIAMIAEEPIRLVEQRIASCDGGGGPLGHPKVFINLDKPGPNACGYCGIRFERAVHH